MGIDPLNRPGYGMSSSIRPRDAHRNPPGPARPPLPDPRPVVNTTASSPAVITTVIFDFGMVICTFDIQLFVKRLSRLAGVAETVVRERLAESTGLAREYETGKMSSDEFFRRFTRNSSISVSKRDFRNAYSDIFSPVPASFDLIRQLKPRYRLGLLSNTSEWHFEDIIKPVEVFPLFDAVTLSYEVKAMKPDKRIYQSALHQLNADPHECVYIDDLPENVDAARLLGLNAIHYTSHEELLVSLRRLGIPL